VISAVCIRGTDLVWLSLCRFGVFDIVGRTALYIDNPSCVVCFVAFGCLNLFRFRYVFLIFHGVADLVVFRCLWCCILAIWRHFVG